MDRCFLCVFWLCLLGYCHPRSLPNTCPQNLAKSGDNVLYIYKNARIYTVDGPNWDQNPQQAMAVKNGLITFVGSNTAADALATGWSKVIDLGGKTVFPGFHDVHLHPLEAGSPIGGTCQLKRGLKPLEMDLNNLIKDCAKKQVGTDWVLGWGHALGDLLQHITGGGEAPRLLLDRAFTAAGLAGTPAVFMEWTSHSMWVNSAALAMAGIDRNTQITGGIILKDSSGEPNGVLLENAGNYIMDMAFDPVKYPKLEDLTYDGLLYGLGQMNSNGITSACDAREYFTRKSYKAYEKAVREGKLTARMILGLWAYPHKTNTELITEMKKLYSNDPSNLLRMSQVKVYMDGVLHPTTAAVLDPYLIDLGIIPGNKGINYITESRLSELITALQSVDASGGFDFHIHAIGDRGVREALNAIQNAQVPGPNPARHKLTHVELVSAQDLPRFQQLGVLADLQVAGDWATDAGAVDELAELVDTKADGYLPVKSLVTNGADVTLSSDWDVSTLNPFVGMSHALQRGNPDESVDLKTAVEMYTINAAYVMRQECSVGALKPGYYADFVTINQDIFAVTPSQIKDTKVSQTWLGGQIVYSGSQTIQGFWGHGLGSFVILLSVYVLN